MARDLFRSSLYRLALILIVVDVAIAADSRVGATKLASEIADRDETRTTLVASGFVYPWCVAFLPDGSALVTERPGRLRIIRDGKVNSAPVVGLPRVVNLFDVVVDPEFSANSRIYISYSAADEERVGLEVMRGTLKAGVLHDISVIFRATPKIANTVLFGGRLLFDARGNLLVTVSDGPGEGYNAQDPQTHLGKIIRIAHDGGVPPDNPFRERREVAQEIYSTGHRNVQGIALDRVTKEIWFAEHGPSGGDELNQLHGGANYGWPISTVGERSPRHNYSAINSFGQVLRGPIASWTPSIAPSGLTFYRGSRFPEWRGSIFVGSLVRRSLLRLEVSGGKLVVQATMLADLNERIRDVREGPDGYLYVLTDSLDGKLLRVEPAAQRVDQGFVDTSEP